MVSNPAVKKRVLIVDDEPDFAALLRSILVKAGYTVATANNCEDALKSVRKARPDLITLDVHMPRKSGVYFYHRLKEIESCRDIPVIVVTGVMREDKEMGNIVRALLDPQTVPQPQAYVDKPVDGAHFLRTVEETLS